MTAAIRGPVIFVDADNTLWDTDGVYAEAQLQLLEDVQCSVRRSVTGGVDPLGFLRSLDQAIAAKHQDGLRYPPAILVAALVLAFEGVAPVKAAREALRGGKRVKLPQLAIEAIVDRFFRSLARPPALREGVQEGLVKLRDKSTPVLIVTEGVAPKVEATAERLNLSGLFDRVLEGRKRPEFYRRILKLVGSPSNSFMVGDQLDRDIVPAKAAGLSTIYFPGGFNPGWQIAEVTANPDHKIASFAEVPALVLASAD